MKTKLSYPALLIFIALTIIWGSSFILIKKGLIIFDPFQLGSLRIIITFIALLPFALRYIHMIKRKEWLILAISGSVGSFFPAYLFAMAQEGINSSTAGILNSLTPLFTLLIGVFIFTFKAKWWNYLGILITFIGTYGLLSVSGGQDFSFNFRYGSMILLASLFYGIQVNIIKYLLSHIPSLNLVAIQFFIIGIPALIILFFFTDFIQIASFEPKFLEGLLYIGILSLVATALALVLFYRLVKLVDPVFSSSVTYFVPAIATLWGIIDGEEIGGSYFLWVTIILAGVFLINNKNTKVFKLLTKKNRIIN